MEDGANSLSNKLISITPIRVLVETLESSRLEDRLGFTQSMFFNQNPKKNPEKCQMISHVLVGLARIL
jgi:hypothetical protein